MDKFLFVADFHQDKPDFFPSQVVVACQTPKALPAQQEALMKITVSKLEELRLHCLGIPMEPSNPLGPARCTEVHRNLWAGLCLPLSLVLTSIPSPRTSWGAAK